MVVRVFYLISADDLKSSLYGIWCFDITPGMNVADTTQRRERHEREREMNIIVTIRKRTISIIYSGGNIWAVSPRPLLALLFIDPLK